MDPWSSQFRKAISRVSWIRLDVPRSLIDRIVYKSVPRVNLNARGESVLDLVVEGYLDLDDESHQSQQELFQNALGIIHRRLDWA